MEDIQRGITDRWVKLNGLFKGEREEEERHSVSVKEGKVIDRWERRSKQRTRWYERVGSFPTVHTEVPGYWFCDTFHLPDSNGFISGHRSENVLDPVQRRDEEELVVLHVDARQGHRHVQRRESEDHQHRREGFLQVRKQGRWLQLQVPYLSRRQ